MTEVSRHLKYNASFRKRVSISDEELQGLFEILTQRIQAFPKRLYLRHMGEAITLADHREDSHYLALALHLKAPIWSNDKGFKSQDKVLVYSTLELIHELQR